MTLSCDASGNPVPTFSWTIGGAPVNTTANPRISLSSDKKQLTITNVNRSDSGDYKCVSNNNVGTVDSNAAALNVQCKNTCYVMFIFMLKLGWESACRIVFI